MRPLCIDLFCGLGGWSDGFLAEGWEVVGFDIERHRYPARAINKDHVKAKGADWNRGDSFNGTTEKQWRESPLTGGWDEYPGQLVLQDVLTLHGRQFRNAACIVASPPCQEFSFRAMPWKVAKAKHPRIVGVETPDWWKLPEPQMSAAQMNAWEAWKDLYPADPPSTALFDACFRIQREASEAAGRHIPLVVENVKGAQPWVGRAKANYGSFYLWGDVESVGGRIVAAHQVAFGAPAVKAYRGRKPDTLVDEFNGHDDPRRGRVTKNGSWFAIGADGKSNLAEPGRKVPGLNFHEHEKTGKPGRSFQSAAVESAGVKQAGMSGPVWFDKGADSLSSKSSARKAASAQIAKIPLDLARYIARSFKPQDREAVA